MTTTPTMPAVPGTLWKAMIRLTPETDPAIITDAIKWLPGFLSVFIVADKPRPEVIEVPKGLTMAEKKLKAMEDYDG